VQPAQWLLGSTGGSTMMHWYGWDGMGAWGWIGMILMMVFWFGLIAIVLVVLVRLVTGESSRSKVGPTEHDRSMSILRERFARGEITEDEFNTARRTLDSSAH
jgi:putative membrane protein